MVLGSIGWLRGNSPSAGRVRSPDFMVPRIGASGAAFDARRRACCVFPLSEIPFMVRTDVEEVFARFSCGQFDLGDEA